MLNRKSILKVVVSTCLTLCLIAVSAFAKSSQAELNDYTSIQTLLAKDTFAGVSEAAKKLSADAKKNHHPELAQAAAVLSETKDLASARAQFITVSHPLLTIAKAEKDANFVVVYCPMKKARWVQKNGPIANPYYGSEMLECGVKEK